MSEEDREAQELLAQMNVNDVESDEESEDMDPEAMAEKFRREIAITPDNCLDVILLGTSDLDQAVVDFEKLTGEKPFLVTSMNGAGTKSARIAFEDCCYLELIGPDSKQKETEFAKALAALPAGELVPCHYGVRWEKSKEMETRMEWKKMGLEYDQLTMVAKDQGMPWMWDFYVFKGDGLTPFITDWSTHDCIHASAKLPIVGTLTNVSVSAPGDHVVHKLLDNPKNMDLSVGPPKLEFTISSKTGSHTFTTDSPIGVSFPEEGGIQ